MSVVLLISRWRQKAQVIAGMLLLASVINLVLLLVIASLINCQERERIPMPQLRPIDFIRTLKKIEPAKPLLPPEPAKTITQSLPPLVKLRPISKPAVINKAKPKPAMESKITEVAAPKLDIPLQGTGSIMASVNGLDSRVTAPPAKWNVEKKPVESEADIPVTRKLLAVSRVMPVYPWRAKSLRTEGWVKVEVIVATDGTVSKVTVIDGQPKDVFAEAAVTALKQWRFQPAYVEGRVVSQRAIQVLEFQLK